MATKKTTKTAAKKATPAKAAEAKAAKPPKATTAAATTSGPKAEGKAKAKAGPKTATGATTAAQAATAAKTAGAAVDAFGSRLGSKAAKVNACLTKEPKKMPQIISEAGMDQTFYNHLNKLAAAGKVLRTEEGYRLP
jgi:hypothetical protein